MDFYEVVRKRLSVRRYRPDPIPDEVLNRILEAGRLAPSAKNLQPWHFIVVKDERLRKELAVACRNQHFIAEAPVVVCGCADRNRCYAKMGGIIHSYPVDLGIAMEHIILAATAEGLGTCWIGAFEEPEVKRILAIPDHLTVVALTPIGYPAVQPQPRSRKPLDEIVSFDYYRKR
ncbi:nitroreductase [candidate division WOR-3 bacterium]|uniref:Nitroreductase n=1 Tax=candidate division WOR-3 bacterium TaxID=2052148 RepID=A0A660SF90_UNCW3|nr:MAG: nitroreductase [candidate division WOR-3 bacterium]